MKVMSWTAIIRCCREKKFEEHRDRPNEVGGPCTIDLSGAHGTTVHIDRSRSLGTGIQAQEVITILSLDSLLIVYRSIRISNLAG